MLFVSDSVLSWKTRFYLVRNPQCMGHSIQRTLLAGINGITAQDAASTVRLELAQTGRP
jgi:hypothetical protein